MTAKSSPDALGDRMKRYEAASGSMLPRRLPLVIRVDGRAFHTFTRGILEKPFDGEFREAMASVARVLCEQVAGAKFAYTQSDEVSVLVTNDDKIETQPWFDNDLCKMVSVSAALATWRFRDWQLAKWTEPAIRARQALFDSRIFVLPPEEICNYFIWRQRDWERNSIQMAARAHFSQKQIHGLNNSQLQDKLWKEKRINWNDYPTMNKRGACVVPGQKILPPPHEDMARGRGVDLEPPIFTKDRKYVERRFRWPEVAN